MPNWPEGYHAVQKLTRTTFEVSRETEFFTEKELQMQIGHARSLWPTALLKELIDNSLDACESAGISPVIEVVIEDEAFGVRDNGQGLPEQTLAGSLNYLTRISDKAFYVSPSRGQLGNALKTVWAAPYVAHLKTEGEGRVEVWTQGKHHTVLVSLDRIAQRPVVQLISDEDETVKTGTFVRVHWPDLACSVDPKNDDSYDEEDDEEEDSLDTDSRGFMRRARRLVERYAAFNPHATFALGCTIFEATVPAWKKWIPSEPTSAHWYNPETFRDLIAAYISSENGCGKLRTVREFIAEFSGLSATAKQKEAMNDLSVTYLRDLIRDRDIDMDRARKLLETMQALSGLVKPVALGVIGEDHLKAWAVRYAGVAEQSFRYKKKLGGDALPHVLEVGFGIRKEGRRIVVTGLNWSPTLVAPPREITSMLQRMRIDEYDPVTVVVHIARPRFNFVDRGKTRLELDSTLKDDLATAFGSIAKSWKQAKQTADRGNIARHRLDQMRYKPQRVTIRDVAFDAMEAAYMKASAGGRYPANARQIYYAARPAILSQTGKFELDSQYFTQTLLKDFMEEFNPSWDVVFDARGHITEPHTDTIVGLGGLEVREHVAAFTDDKINETPYWNPPRLIDTVGPGLRYGAVLFIEKEGFGPLLKAAKIAERFDLAVASTKGMPVSAACDLLATLKKQRIKVFAVHDFDKSGFGIVATLGRGTRGSRGAGEVVDLGFRLADIEGLEREDVSYPGDPSENLTKNGASEAEIEILAVKDVQGYWGGQRVELNAMTSDQFVAWLERKLVEHGIKKLIPDDDALAAAYRRAAFLCNLRDAAKQLRGKAAQSIVVPDDLASKVAEALRDEPELPWDEAIWNYCRGE
jgi:DNA topoisomerase VI subunit B/DNA topoisomerase VI subunit A